jgi:hypothetical protein
MAKATGILPFAGGVSLLVAMANVLSELVATTTPKQALVLMKSLLFMFQPPRAVYWGQRGVRFTLPQKDERAT